MRRALIAAGVAALAVSAASAAGRDAVWVERRTGEWQPTAREKRWASIGWAAEIRPALRLAREHERPVFLFTLDGRMGVGRC